MLALWALCGVDHGEHDGAHHYSVDVERLDFLLRHGHPALADDPAHEILEALSLVARELGDPGAYERSLGDGER